MKLLNMNLLMKHVLHMKLPYTNSLLLVLTAFSHMKDVATINYVGKFFEFFSKSLSFVQKTGKKSFRKGKKIGKNLPFCSLSVPNFQFRKAFRSRSENFGKISGKGKRISFRTHHWQKSHFHPYSIHSWFANGKTFCLLCLQVKKRKLTLDQLSSQVRFNSTKLFWNLTSDESW